MSDARKCLHCGGDLPDEEASHCSAECLINATHIITDQIVDGATKDLLAMCREKLDDPVNHPSHYTAYKGLEVIGEDSPEQFLVWICYIADNHGNPLVVKVVPTKKKALEWLRGSPHNIGKKDDDEVRGHRFVESFVVETD